MNSATLAVLLLWLLRELILPGIKWALAKRRTFLARLDQMEQRIHQAAFTARDATRPADVVPDNDPDNL